MMAGISSAQSSEGMLQMIKKREKMNNSAMSTQSKPSSSGPSGSKRTPTANAAMIAGGNSRDSQNS